MSLFAIILLSRQTTKLPSGFVSMPIEWDGFKTSSEKPLNSETHNWWKSREWESVECSAENGVSLSPFPEGSVTITEKGQEDLRRQNSGSEIVSSRSNSTTDSWTHGSCGCLHKPYTFKSVRILTWSGELRIPHPWLRGYWQQMDPERELGTTMWCWEWS